MGGDVNSSQDHQQQHVPCTVEPRYNEGPRDWQNMFAIRGFRFINKKFVIPTTSLYRGLLYRGSSVPIETPELNREGKKKRLA